MATLKGQSIAASYQDLVKRADTYAQTGTNIELMDDSGDVQATGLYLESGATTDFVGIGVASPSVTFEIKSPSGNVHIQKIISSDDQSLFTFEQKATGGAARFDMYNAGASSTIKFDTDGDSYFNGGNVGIGTATPAVELEVASADRTSVRITGVQSGSDGVIGDLQFFNNADSIGAINVNRVDNDDQSDMTFHTQPTGGAVTERMRIDSSGNVGIGDTSPDEKLSVYGGLLRIGNDDSNHLTMGRAASGHFEIARTCSGVADQVFFQAKESDGGDISFPTGNVGIGTSSPASLLTVAKAVASGGGTGDVTMTILNSDEPATTETTQSAQLDLSLMGTSDSGSSYSANPAGRIKATKDGSDWYNASGFADWDGQLEFYTVNGGSLGTAKMVIDTDGNVGIGTAAPDGTLHVHTATCGSQDAHAEGDDLVVENSDHAGISILTPNDKKGHIMFGDVAGELAGRITYDHNVPSMSFYTEESLAMTIDTNQNVGIGTAAPGQILDVNSGGGNMIADGYDTHSLAVYKENIEDASGYLDKVLACPAQKWNRKPFVSANEIKEAVLEELGEDVLIEEAVEAQDAVYETVVVQEAVEEELWAEGDELPEDVEIGDVKTEAQEEETEEQLVSEAIEAKDAVYEKQYSVWDELFPEDNSHRQKALYNMPDGDLKTWIDDWCEAKRVEMRPEDKWQKKRLGLVADAELTAEHLPEVVSINDDGEPTGIDTMTYIGILHNAIQELSAKVEALENA